MEIAPAKVINRCTPMATNSCGATRSIVQTMEEKDFKRLDHIRWCPTQFQAFVPGTNLRAHVIGEEIFATAIRADATDYRCPTRQSGEPAELREAELSSLVSCRRSAARLGVAGQELSRFWPRSG